MSIVDQPSFAGLSGMPSAQRARFSIGGAILRFRDERRSDSSLNRLLTTTHDLR
jgi:hypothetical protein